MSTPPPISSSDAPPAPPREHPKIGDLNVLEASIGKRGMGKSTHQAMRAMELQRETGGYVIGHSLGQRIPAVLPDGTRLDIKYHQTLQSLSRGLSNRPGQWHMLAPKLVEEGGSPTRESADDLMRYSIRLSTALRDRAWWDAHPLRLWKPASVNYTGLRCPPVIVLLDEGIAVDAASTGDSATGKNKWFLEYVYSIRHLHIALFYSIQEPTSRSWRVLESSTAVNVFRLDHAWALNAIQAAGATPEMVAKIRSLPKYEHVAIRSEDGYDFGAAARETTA